MQGVDRMYNEMQKAGLPEPEYRNESFMLNAIIRNCVLNESEVTDDEKELLAALKENPHHTYESLSQKLSVSRKTIEIRIKSLKEKKLITRIGSDNDGYWQINE